MPHPSLTSSPRPPDVFGFLAGGATHPGAQSPGDPRPTPGTRARGPGREPLRAAPGLATPTPAVRLPGGPCPAPGLEGGAPPGAFFPCFLPFAASQAPSGGDVPRDGPLILAGARLNPLPPPGTAIFPRGPRPLPGPFNSPPPAPGPKVAVRPFFPPKVSQGKGLGPGRGVEAKTDKGPERGPNPGSRGRGKGKGGERARGLSAHKVWGRWKKRCLPLQRGPRSRDVRISMVTPHWKRMAPERGEIFPGFHSKAQKPCPPKEVWDNFYSCL